MRFEENKPQKVSADEIEAEIIYIDRFGNLITNLEKGRFARKVCFGNRRRENRKTAKLLCRSQKIGAVYDFRKRGLFRNCCVSGFGGNSFASENRSESFG